jgi:hypothetical protein
MADEADVRGARCLALGVLRLGAAARAARNRLLQVQIRTSFEGSDRKLIPRRLSAMPSVE